jgi:biopolymer transport protein ExbD
MLNNRNKRLSFDAEAFDMTPIIDVVFLLIIFFMLVCQFIAAEKFQVQVPDNIESARSGELQEKGPPTITVMAGADGRAVYAVDSTKLGYLEGKDLAELIRLEIDRSPAVQASTEKTIRLRCDKTITFGEVKHILSGISKSTAETVDWAVLGE